MTVKAAIITAYGNDPERGGRVADAHARPESGDANGKVIVTVR